MQVYAEGTRANSASLVRPSGYANVNKWFIYYVSTIFTQRD